MFESAWSPRLRQGDILGPIPSPLIGKNVEFVTEPGSIVPGSLGPSKAIVPCAERYLAVISHDCEFNEGKRDRILLARLQAVPRGNDVEVIRAANDVAASLQASGKVGGVDAFLIDPVVGHFDDPMLVVFTTMMAFPAKNTLREYSRVKVAELHHDQRLLFKRKLAWFLSRGDDDVEPHERMSPAEFHAQFAD